MRKNLMRMFVCIALVSSFIVGFGAATTVNITPDEIAPGGLFNIEIKDLPSFTSIILQIQGIFSATPGGPFDFTLTDMFWPVNVTSSDSTVQLVNTATNTITINETINGVLKDEYSVSGNSVNGVFSVDIPDMETDYDKNESEQNHTARFTGTAASNANAITASVTINMQKEGPDDFTIPVRVYGIEYGNVLVNCFVDNVLVSSKSIAVRPYVAQQATVQSTASPVQEPVYANTAYAVNPNNVVQQQVAMNFL
jgi:hypothetical protein